MKKVLLTGTALLLSLGFSMAQGWQATGAHDDFATSTQYANGANGEGLNWFGDGVFTITRPGDGALSVAASNIGGAGNWPVFRVNFNEDGSASPFKVNLSGGQADIEIDVENVSSNQLFIKIELEDADGDKSDIEPNISDILSTHTWADGPPYPRKANNGLVLAANSRETFRIDLSSVPAFLGGLTRSGWVGNGPFDGPTTNYVIDPSKIVAVIFTVNYNNETVIFSQGDGDHTADYIIEGVDIQKYTGTIKFHDFKIGSTITTGVTETAAIDASLKVYPNPASGALNVSFQSEAGAEVTLSDVVGNKVFSTTSTIGENKITMNTSSLSSGIYVLSVATENGRVARKVAIK